MPEIIAQGACMTFRDVRRDRHGSAPQLSHEPVALRGGELLRGGIWRLDEGHRLLPDPEIAIAPHPTRCLDGRAHDKARDGTVQKPHAGPLLAPSFHTARPPLP